MTVLIIYGIGFFITTRKALAWALTYDYSNPDSECSKKDSGWVWTGVVVCVLLWPAVWTVRLGMVICCSRSAPYLLTGLTFMFVGKPFKRIEMTSVRRKRDRRERLENLHQNIEVLEREVGIADTSLMRRGEALQYEHEPGPR